jgi:hypothetical protein
LARIAPNADLPLAEGLNPAWEAAMRRFRDLVAVPLLGPRTRLTARDWETVKDRFAAYAAWQAAKPSNRVESLGRDRVLALQDGAPRAELEDLIARDKALEAEAAAIDAVEKLIVLRLHLFRLVNNFVSFRDFYNRRSKAIFQAGTLYLDGRSAELCVAVNDAGKHASLATLARMCLVYVDCVRGSEKMSVAAAFTAGDSDQLIVGRNGVFYDRQGRDWNATITKMVEHPISLRQAFWSPYKRLARLVSEQLQKIAASKAKASEDQMGALAQGVAKKAEPAKPAAAPTAFDVGKFAGIFAAIGLAVGALGTALASVLTGLFALKWWQIPLALAGLLLGMAENLCLAVIDPQWSEAVTFVILFLFILFRPSGVFGRAVVS